MTKLRALEENRKPKVNGQACGAIDVDPLAKVPPRSIVAAWLRIWMTGRSLTSRTKATSCCRRRSTPPRVAHMRRENAR